MSMLMTPAMQQAIGQVVYSATVEVERGAIRRFVEAVWDANLRHLNDRDAAAPPTFLRSVQPAIPPLPDAERVTRVLDGGSAWEYFTPIHPGDRLHVLTIIQSIKERESRQLGTMLLIDYFTSYTNQHGVLAVTQLNTLIRY